MFKYGELLFKEWMPHCLIMALEQQASSFLGLLLPSKPTERLPQLLPLLSQDISSCPALHVRREFPYPFSLPCLCALAV